MYIYINIFLLLRSQEGGGVEDKRAFFVTEGDDQGGMDRDEGEYEEGDYDEEERAENEYGFSRNNSQPGLNVDYDSGLNDPFGI
jgi:hypothetical protein